MKLRTTIATLITTVAAVLALAGAPANAKPGGTQPLSNKCYGIETQTGDVADGGTDSAVSIQIFGTLGMSTDINLDNPGDDRERGQTDVYGCFNLPDLGTITFVTLTLHGGDRWYVNYAAVYVDNGPGSPAAWCYYYRLLFRNGNTERCSL